MAVVTKRLAKVIISTTSQLNIYTCPQGKMAMVKAVTICNIANADINLIMAFGGATIIANYPIKAKDTITIPFLDQILEAGEAITAQTSAIGINLFISGKEVTP